MYLLSEKEKSTSSDEDSDSSDDHDNPDGNVSSYELAAMKKREENLHLIKRMGIYKSLVCT